MTAVSFGFPSAGLIGPAHATIGTYDGLHRGHLSLLKPMIAGAKRAGATSVLITFEPHPRCVLDPDHCPANLTTLDEKTWLCEQLGLDQMIVIPFTPQVAGLRPAAFMQRLLRGIELRHLMTGYDFAFGQGRRGDHAFLRRVGAKHGFTLEVRPAMERGGAAISSSRIRRLILLGQVRAAALLLGRDYFFRSTVEHGAERGRLLGYPTANLKITPNKLLPANGVYAIRVLIDAAVYIGALNLGFRPTFGGNTLTVEAFLLDFEGDLYGKLLTVSFIQRLRGEKRFSSMLALQQQIARDVENAKRILA
ncbi:MAG TPA: bifunctional riboflavin kinase/FAD synthetase [Candidatus Dormibacteraeota bacterium]